MQGSGVGSAQAVGGAAEFLVLPLHRSLQEYIQQERLSDVECAHCNARQDATRQMVLLELPPVLTLQVRHAIPMIVDRIFSTSTPPSPFPPTSCCPLCTCAVQLLRFVYDLGTGRELQRLAHGGYVWSVAWNAAGTQLATGSTDKFARVFA